MAQEYKVRIRETLEGSAAIYADNAEQAERIARYLWEKGSITLDWDDFSSVEFDVKEAAYARV